jgi:hypothetical protein
VVGCATTIPAIKARLLAAYTLGARLTLEENVELCCGLCNWLCYGGAFNNIGDRCGNTDCGKQEDGDNCELHFE